VHRMNGIDVHDASADQPAGSIENFTPACSSVYEIESMAA
jgi:hypothetical protein